jgi:hypothetical protein
MQELSASAIEKDSTVAISKVELMKSKTHVEVPFRVNRDDGACRYSLAFVQGVYVSGSSKEPSSVILCFSPSSKFSRYSFVVLSRSGTERMFLDGPVYSVAVEAALIEGWSSLEVPPYAWSLVTMGSDAKFASKAHKDKYLARRKDLCKALYEPKVKSWAKYDMKIEPSFLPLDGEYKPDNPFAKSRHNEELLAAAIDKRDKSSK